AVMKIKIHIKRSCDGTKTITQSIKSGSLLGNETDPHEKTACIQIVKLGTIDNVATFAGQITGNRGNDSTRGLAGDGQDKVMHQTSSISQAQPICVFYCTMQYRPCQNA